jgi:hypothetical protein
MASDGHPCRIIDDIMTPQPWCQGLWVQMLYGINNNAVYGVCKLLNLCGRRCEEWGWCGALYSSMSPDAPAQPDCASCGSGWLLVPWFQRCLTTRDVLVSLHLAMPVIALCCHPSGKPQASWLPHAPSVPSVQSQKHFSYSPGVRCQHYIFTWECERMGING